MRSILLTIGAAALLSGCGGDDRDAAMPPASTPATAPATATSPSPSAAGKQTVAIKDFKFGPAVQIAAGGSVEWSNEDTAPHNAVGDDFKTADLDARERDRVVFDTPGTYDYVCTFHPFMKGSIVVR